MARAKKSMENKKTYTPKSQILNPIKLLLSIASDLKRSHFLAWRLLDRDISSKYRQTMTGYLSAILPPVVTAVIFIILNKASILNVSETSIPYPVFVVTGTLMWDLFMTAINAPLNELQTNRSLLVRISFAKEALILTSLGQILFNFVIKAVVLVGILLFFKVDVSSHCVLVILPVMTIVTLGVLIGLFLTPVSFLFQDIRQAITMLFSLLMYVSPVAYPLPKTGIIGIVGKYNPFAYTMDLFRNLLFTEKYDFIGITLIIFAVSFFLLLVTLVLFRISIPYLVERMDA